jgi:4-phosphopantoate--beta-alanine ligase
LTTRDKLVEGWENGLVATQGLIAHGRGEAFDYLIGERTTDEAEDAIRAAAWMLSQSQQPVISVNGNVGALSAGDIKNLSDVLSCRVEVNIFHRTGQRMKNLVKHLEKTGIKDVLGLSPDARIPGLDHARSMCCMEGIFTSDVVLVPLEDGDRCQALRGMGKKVITIDLNPLSRTSKTADITIVDNLTRALPELTRMIKEGPGEVMKFDNEENLLKTLRRISGRF